MKPRNLAILFSMVLLSASIAEAAWPHDPLINVPISTVSGEKADVYLTTDSHNGALIVWEDQRAGQADIYMQRLNEEGDPVWTLGGVPVCTANDHQNLYHSSDGTCGVTPVISDGLGGAFVVWQDSRLYSMRQRDIYCQRLGSDGLPLWTTNGVAIAVGAGNEEQPTMCSDGAGGVIIVWQDKNNDPIFDDIFAQRISADGVALWNNGNPLPVSILDWSQANAALCSDGLYGAFVVFTDNTNDVNDLRAQHLSADGELLWGNDGVVVVAANDNQKSPVIIESEDGNPIVSWRDLRSGNYDIYAQKLDATTGASLWNSNGLALCTAANSQYRPSACTDGHSGVIVSWFDYRTATGFPWDLNIFAQRAKADGSIAWQYNGVPVCLAEDAQRDSRLVSDDHGGAIIAWEDNRQGTGREDIYVQHLNGVGQPNFVLDGRAICIADGNQERPNLVLAADGAIVAWTDDRNTLYAPDIYADMVEISIPIAASMPSVPNVDLEAWPNPFNPQTMITFDLPAETHVEISIYDLAGNRMITLLPATTLQEGPHTVPWQPQGFAAGVYLVQLKTPNGIIGRKLTLVP
jgi:hypothetical protein